MRDDLRCRMCDAVLPLAKQATGKIACGAVAAAIGAPLAKSLPGALLLTAIGVGVGHAIDVAARPICGRCGTPA